MYSLWRNLEFSCQSWQFLWCHWLIILQSVPRELDLVDLDPPAEPIQKAEYIVVYSPGQSLRPWHPFSSFTLSGTHVILHGNFHIGCHTHVLEFSGSVGFTFPLVPTVIKWDSAHSFIITMSLITSCHVMTAPSSNKQSNLFSVCLTWYGLMENFPVLGLL